MHASRQGTHSESLQCVTITTIILLRWHARYTTKVERVDRTNATPGHWVYANIEASRTVMLRTLGVHRWKHYYYYYYSASDICSFSSGRALCGTRGDRRSDTYAAHTPIRRRHRHTINIIVFSFIALSE